MNRHKSVCEQSSVDLAGHVAAGQRSSGLARDCTMLWDPPHTQQLPDMITTLETFAFCTDQQLSASSIMLCFILYDACRNSHFATFTISSLQHSYQEALHSLHMELLTTRRRAAAAHKQQHGPSSPPQLTPQQLQQMSPGAAAAAVSGSSSAGLSALLGVCVREEELELQLVQILLGLMYHELVSGHTEQVVAKIQV